MKFGRSVLLFLVFIAAAPPLAAGQPGSEPHTGPRGVVPPDVAQEFAGRELPSLERLALSGRLSTAAPSRAAAWPLYEKAFITQWLTHYSAIPGTLEEDTVGESAITAVCSSQKLTTAANAPSMWGSYISSSDGRMWNYHWNSYKDSATCSNDYTDLVKYYLTQVRSDTARSAKILVGADDGIKVWLNGSVAIDQAPPADYAEGQYVANVQLQSGWNLLVVKLYFPKLGPDTDPDYESKTWSLRFTEADGTTPLSLPQSYDGWCSQSESQYGWAFAGSVAHLDGKLGSTWRSDLRLTNPYHFPLILTLEYFAEGTVAAAGTSHASAGPAASSAGPDATIELLLDPYETRVYNDVLPALGIPGGQKGMLAVRGFYYWDAVNNGVAGLRTYNQSGAGTFGTTIPFRERWYGYTCCSWSLLGLRNGPGFRTNLACVPRIAMDDEVTFTVSIWDPATGTTGKQTFTGRGYFQINDVFKAVGLQGLVTDSAVAKITWSPTPNSAYLAFSATVNDNGTSDPVYVSRGYWFTPAAQQ